MLPHVNVVLDQNAKNIYERVFEAVSKGNSGKVAVCCGVFFTKGKADNHAAHLDVVSMAEFKKREGIHTLESFVLWARRNASRFDLKLNASDCTLSSERLQFQKLHADLSNAQKLLSEAITLRSHIKVDSISIRPDSPNPFGVANVVFGTEVFL